MTGLKEEVTDELLGRSSKRWGLLLAALLAGASAAFWLTNRTRPAAVVPEPSPDEAAGDAGNTSSRSTTRSTAAATLTTAWTRISQPGDAPRTLPTARLFRRAPPSEPAD
jgi:hypothetical protein